MTKPGSRALPRPSITAIPAGADSRSPAPIAAMRPARTSTDTSRRGGAPVPSISSIWAKNRSGPGYATKEASPPAAAGCATEEAGAAASRRASASSLFIGKLLRISGYQLTRRLPVQSGLPLLAQPAARRAVGNHLRRRKNKLDPCCRGMTRGFRLWADVAHGVDHAVADRPAETKSGGNLVVPAVGIGPEQD